MHCLGFVADYVTATYILKACGNIGNPIKSREIHAFITKVGLDREPAVGNALVDVYEKCNSPLEAKHMFDKLLSWDVVSWTTLIAGYAGHGVGEAALNCFEQMLKEGVPGSAVTYVCSLKACGSSGAVMKGRLLHSHIAKVGLESESHVGNALVDMYSKCGLCATMQEVFDRILVPDIIAWNSLIAGYAQLGESKSAFETFKRLSEGGIWPDIFSFTSLLNACCNTGLVDMGSLYFQAIENGFGCVPSLDHYTCMVHLLGRAGSLGSAISCLEWMPFQPGVLPWQIFLGACRKWGDTRLGRLAFDQVVSLDANAATAYICLYNLYADIETADQERKVEWSQDSSACRK
ncbi:hypothetical protein L7F22_064381 [Adiantum nelumboides]|nr:hypothetical protein [Adiantum nelumboides]